ncbi:MAG: LacI family transcriptional regulator [Actinomycetota bacterium]|nr:LacI family transcriptional regulator [Actinomycetota bacterium]
MSVSGDKTIRPTIRMVALEAGVSTATVSYVLSGRPGGSAGAPGPGVSPATVRRVQDAAARLGYRPNQAARAIRTGRTKTVLLSLTMLSDPWSLAVIAAVQRAAEPLDITPMILADADWAKVLQHQSADAVFVDAVPDGSQEQLTRLAEQGTRLVVFDELLKPAGFDVIRSVAAPGCVLAVEHLLTKHRKIGCLISGPHLTGTTVARPASAGRPTSAVSSGRPSPRFAAYSETLAAAGIGQRPDYVAAFEAGGAYAAAMKLLIQEDAPTAIYAVTDYAAVSAINAAQRLGLTVGRDVDIIGVGNTVEGEQMSPSLSTVGPVDFFDRVAALLLERATGADAQPHVMEFPWQLFVRESAPG